MIRDNIDIFSTNNSFYTNKEYFAFDILFNREHSRFLLNLDMKKGSSGVIVIE